MNIADFMDVIVRRNPGETEFHQAVHEVAEKVIPTINQNRDYEEARILERLTEPDRILMFRVTWEDDAGNVCVNRGYRVQQSNAIGPYKGGLRFDASVTLSVLKFLAFEQIFKNALTTLPMGGAKGGSDFSPKGKSNHEIMRFCQAFMTELHRYIGEDVDVPAGDIGVSSAEIGYLFGQYKRLQNEFTGAITGKGAAFGGSFIRTEATGYGCVYFAREMLQTQNDSIAGKRCVVSGAGNVAQYAAEKLIDLGATVVTLSDRSGFIHFTTGITRSELLDIIHLKTDLRGSLADFARKRKLTFCANQQPWKVPCDMAFPCATQNEIDEQDAHDLLHNGCTLVSEGANMPATPAASRAFENASILLGPAKAANAGGVAISGLEMTQNAMRLYWTREDVDDRLQTIMRRIHQQCLEHGNENGRVNYVAGANIAAFKKVADAMLAYGIV